MGSAVAVNAFQQDGWVFYSSEFPCRLEDYLVKLFVDSEFFAAEFGHFGCETESLEFALVI